MSRVRSLAWQFAFNNGFPGIPLEKHKLGRTWARGFLKRFPKLTCWKAVNLSVARAMAANELNVRKWFMEYKKVLNDLNINSPEQIWSGDETGVQNVPKEEVVLCVKGKKAYQIVAAEQGETSTILTFINGVGNVVPPMVIYKGECVQTQWTRDVPVGVHIAATSKGYITKQKFHEYGIRFVRWLKTHRKLEKPHLLIIDSHKSHVYNVAFFDCMKANNIHVLAIPPHISHIVQALDSTPFAQFKELWQRHLKEWNFDNKAKCLPKVSFWEVFWPAWSHSMTVGNIQSGFRKTGVYPVNYDAIDKSKFTPSIVTDSKKICSL